MMRVLLTLLLLLPMAALAEAPAEPSDYRMEEYRSPVPETLAGATVITTDEAHVIWTEKKAAFIDVLPMPPKPENLPEGTIWRDKPRDSIPGTIWLPNVGYGAIADVTADYFRTGLEKATDNDTARPVVIFCRDDCWMSWNAAKRAVEWGYTGVYWMPEGTDGWTAGNYPTEQVLPQEPQP